MQSIILDSVTLTLPVSGPDLNALTDCARLMRVTRSELISRALVVYLEDLEDTPVSRPSFDGDLRAVGLGELELVIPDDGPRLGDIERCARAMQLSTDELISAAVLAYLDEVAMHRADPVVMAQFDVDVAAMLPANPALEGRLPS